MSLNLRQLYVFHTVKAPHALRVCFALSAFAILAALSGCHYMENEPAKESVSEASYTLTDKRLVAILEKEKKLVLQMSLMPETTDTRDYQRRATSIAREYKSFLADNPDNILGHILYGKFLREVGERQLANVQFVKANRLDPNIAVVKQQIANFLAEEGVFDLALPYMLAAIELEPNEPKYHFQLGELLYTYGAQIVSSGILDRESYDHQMINAFTRAAELEPDNRDYLFRRAEAFYDMKNPDWQDALILWTELRELATSEREVDVIELHRARALIKLNRNQEARDVLNSIDRPALQQSKQELLELIQSIKEDRNSRIIIGLAR